MQYVRQWDPVNKVWMRVIPNLGMNFTEWAEYEDELLCEVFERSPFYLEYLMKLVSQHVDR